MTELDLPHAATLRNLVSSGTNFLEKGRVQEAFAYFSRALAVEPGNIDSVHLYGVACEQPLGLSDSAKFLKRATILRPTFAAALSNLGATQSKIGDIRGALQSQKKALVLDPALSAAYMNISGIHARDSEHDLASRFSIRRLRFSPNDDQSLHNLAVAMTRLNRIDDADIAYQKTLVLAPHRSDSIFGFYKTHDDKVLKKLKSKWLIRAACIDPYSAAFHSELGLRLADLENYQEAAACFQRAMTLDPTEQEHCNNLGLSLGNIYQDIQALRFFSRAMILQRQNAFAHYNAGISLSHAGFLDESTKSYERACVIDPSHIDSLWNRSHALLLAGNYELGWREFEWRWLIEKFRNLRRTKIKKASFSDWESLHGKTILLIAEQGLGDTIQFVRYAPLLSLKGARVAISAQGPLTRLLANQSGIDVVTAWGEPLPPHDAQYFMMSLPLLFGTTLDSVPFGDSPYLRALPFDVARWSACLDAHLPVTAGAPRRLRVGIVWNGGFRPDQPDVWSLNKRRNVPLKLIADALDNPDIDFVSLQKGDPAESEIRGKENHFWRKARFCNPTSELKDFADTAALVSNLDLVIGVDTSTTHLSGALGVPTWLLNRYDTCWRWLLRRDDSPWYQSLRIYRQESNCDWQPVLSRVANDLRQYALDHRTEHP